MDDKKNMKIDDDALDSVAGGLSSILIPDHSDAPDPQISLCAEESNPQLQVRPDVMDNNDPRLTKDLNIVGKDDIKLGVSLF